MKLLTGLTLSYDSQLKLCSWCGTCMHCKPNPLENGKRSDQQLNSTRCRCDAHLQHWNIWADTSKPKSFTYIYQKDRVIQVLFWSNLRFLSARLLLVESPHCFLLCGPMLVFSAPVTFGLGLLMGWLALWITLSGLTTMPVRSNELCCIVFPVWEARIVTWVKNTSHFIIWLFLNYHIKV